MQFQFDIGSTTTKAPVPVPLTGDRLPAQAMLGGQYKHENDPDLWQSTSPLRGHALAVLRSTSGHEVGQRTVAGGAAGRDRPDVNLLLARQGGQRLQRGHVSDPGQDGGGAEQ